MWASLIPSCRSSHTFLVIVVDNGILQHVREVEMDPLALAMLRPGQPFLPEQCPLPLVVGLDLLTAHTSHQALALSQGNRLQQALVNFHVMGSENAA